MLSGVEAICFTGLRAAEFRAGLAMPEAGDDDVVLRVSVSVLSPGTERARYLGLPNAVVDFPHFPGYMGAGQVLRGFPGLPAGTSVAVRGTPHHSVVRSPQAATRRIPQRVGSTDAALWQLGLTSLYALSQGRFRPPEPLIVVGAGLLGAMTRRLASALGSPCVAVAASSAKEWSVKAERATAFSTVADAGDHPRRPLVVDATGHPDGLTVAISRVADGGRVVLLGSPRARWGPVDVGAVYARGLSVIGAHVDGLAGMAGSGGGSLRDQLTDEYFRLIGDGAVSFTDLLEEFSPADAARVYERLAEDRSLVGGYFNWALPSSQPGRRPANDAASVAAEVAPGGRRRQARPAGPRAGASRSGPVRFALVGCGDIGVVDAASVAGAAGARLSCTFDLIPGLAAEAAHRYGGHIAGSYAEVLERPDVDAVLVATPHDTHAELAVAALGAGKHVLLEKPLAADLAGAQRIAEACDQSPSSLGVLLPLRADPRFVAAREAIAQGGIGSPAGALSTYLVGKPPSYYEGGYSGRATSRWRQSKARSGGGILIMNLLLHLDAVRALLGLEATRVYAETAASPAWPEIEDLASVVVRFGPVIASFVGAASVAGGTGEAITVWGEEGQVRVLPAFQVVPPRASVPFPDPADPAAADLEARTLAVSLFAAAVADGRPPETSVADALAVQAIVAAAYASVESGVPIDPAAVAP